MDELNDDDAGASDPLVLDDDPTLADDDLVDDDLIDGDGDLELDDATGATLTLDGAGDPDATAPEFPDADGDGRPEVTPDPSLVDTSFDPDPSSSSGSSSGGFGPSDAEPDPTAQDITPDPDTIAEGLEEAAEHDPVQQLIDDTPEDVPLPITPQSTPAAQRDRTQFERLVNDQAAVFAETARQAFIEAKVRGRDVEIRLVDDEDDYDFDDRGPDE